jgi:hypothetical protein
METARYAFRVRGRTSEVVLAALQEGLQAEIGPATTTVHCRLHDQAAVSGMLAWIRLLGLELIEFRRLPRSP